MTLDLIKKVQNSTLDEQTKDAVCWTLANFEILEEAQRIAKAKNKGHLTIQKICWENAGFKPSVIGCYAKTPQDLVNLYI